MSKLREPLRILRFLLFFPQNQRFFLDFQEQHPFKIDHKTTRKMQYLLLPPSEAQGSLGMTSNASKMSPKRLEHGLLAPPSRPQDASPGPPWSLPEPPWRLLDPRGASKNVPEPPGSLHGASQSLPRASPELPLSLPEPPRSSKYVVCLLLFCQNGSNLF